ncbi:protein TolB [Arenicella chitinivorans]|uniref:Tol-Pal system protein TolB n=1 Tax=Arenicella chitinivorans TaxID=1329800 RepID=A0A918RVW5_9GAMM|nr:Tol-Pal system beta propeller repeat protein TolB [Arenicella chitinivorans]GHA11942.1 protein TolB [Arenicella chitinivorans]
MLNVVKKVVSARLWIGMALVLVFAQSAHAQILRGEVGGTVRGIPIAIVPFKVIDGRELAHKIHEVVAFDLNASGKFEAIPSDRFPSLPSRFEEVSFKDWRFVNAEILVIGEVWVLDNDTYEVQFRMFDVAREREVGNGKRIRNLKPSDLRKAAHVVSDSVYEAFTNSTGAYQSRIAYVDRTEVEYQRFQYRLMVADWDGYGAVEVYKSWQPLLSPSWSPDGSKLAFVSYADRGPIVQMIELATGKAQTIADFKGVNAAPAWSPDGSKIAYSTSRHGSPDIYVYDIASGQHERATTHWGIDTEPAWSPRGDSLLFTSNRGRKPQIYSYSLNDQSVSRMTFEGDENANASFDPQGRNLTMVHEGGQIVVMREEDGRMTWLTNSKYDESPSFSPNGDMVLYKTEQGYEPALVVASSDGRVRTRLDLVSGDVREPAWSPLRK